MSGPELKTCPFCGVRPHVHDDASHSTAFFADCCNDNCTIQPSAHGLSKAETIAAWNTRATVTVQDAARVVADGLADGEVWRVAVNGAAAILNSGMPEEYWTPVKQIREALHAALRAIAEGINAKAD